MRKATRKQSACKAHRRRVDGRRLGLELLELRLALTTGVAIDCGDAPAPYPTALSEDGARHIATGVKLGATRGEDSVCQHTPNALGHSTDDGVSFGRVQVGMVDATVRVNVQGGAGRLDAWIDFDRDGSWSGPGEHVFDSRALVEGDNLLEFDVPAFASAGTSYARFRLSSDGDASLRSEASDGEVEDYPIEILAPFPSTGLSTTHAIDEGNGQTRATAMGDLDGDGDTDIVTAYRDKGRVIWFENTGNQTFVERIVAYNAGKVDDVAIADIDQDGNLDVLVATYSQTSPWSALGVNWYRNDGSQGFEKRVVMGLGIGLFDVAAVDIDGDRDIDVIHGWTNSITLHTNDGQANFQRSTIGSVDSIRSVAISDIDGDGDIDVAGSGFNEIKWFENDGQGDFTEHLVATFSGNIATAVAIDDVDGDGLGDVVAGFNDGAIQLYINNGDGSFAPREIFQTPAIVRHVTVVDFDLDGDADVLAAIHLNQVNLIAWYENDGSESFSEHVIPGSRYGAMHVTPGDIDGDGDIDAVAAFNVHDVVVWYENDGAQSFTKHPLHTPPNRVADVEVGDINGDGRLDVVSASPGDSTVAWYESQGEGKYVMRIIDSEVAHVIDASVSDLDGDGDADVLAIDPAGSVHWFESGSQGGFESHVVGAGLLAPQRVSTADIDTDGDTDVLVAHMADEEFSWFENDGNEGFTEHRVPGVGHSTLVDVYPSDLDSDGDIDFIAGTTVSTDALLWYENDGQQNFLRRVIATGSGGNVSITTSDVDRDGDQDILAVSEGGTVVVWYINDGTQQFVRRPIDSFTNSTRAFAADFDGDGDSDVIVADRGNDRVSWYQNDGQGNFTADPSVRSFDDASGLAVGDLDQDGDLDAVVALSAQNTVTWWENLPTGGLDFGDAPAPYPTTFSDGMPVHRAVGPQLGQSRDGEHDGVPSVNADSDGDEDGVLFGKIDLGTGIAGVNIELQNRGASAHVDAWIDFDGDGQWGIDEKILDSQVVVEGLQTLNYSLPASAVAGVTYARVRLSTAGGLSPTGLAPDGEIEDYVVSVLPAAPTVLGFEVNQGELQRSSVTEIEVVFDREVDARSTAFSIIDRDREVEVDGLTVSSRLENGGTVATITFLPGAFVQTRSNGLHSLRDGSYQLNVDGAQITAVSTDLPMAGDVSFGDDAADRFFRFFGDSDGDRDVDGQDYGRFGRSFLKQAGDAPLHSGFDHDGDGDVDGQDYGYFGLNFLKTL
ncbi:FG-GAP repeat protein [Stieleria neptunia]|uniref:FG-GAP repeat protein n=1 Tax=Stieleria neptunia TaxID=2527979 RepID=A0A518I049_9BACT|nr:VCBS repeat-containing protein [Stieleria neptunia]QDV46478.1 FG-GAP repeat protein [Stieleria neptunia]